MSDRRFELIATLYVLCMDYHSGQWSRGYRLLCRIARRYNPRLADGYLTELRAGDLYANLAERYGARL